MERTFENLRKLAAMVIAIGFVVAILPVRAEAKISDYWAEKDVDARLEPHYSDISYTLDPIKTLQRFDAKGDWYWPVTTDMNDSKLILTAATNASLGVVNAVTLDDGMYFEVRAKVAATGTNFTMALKETGGINNVSIYIGAGNNVHGLRSMSSGSNHTNNFGAISADTWYKLGVLFSGTTIVFYAYHDNYSLLGYSQVTNANMTYDDIDEVELKQSVAAKTAYVDYFVQTSTHNELMPVGQASRALRIGTEETVTKRNVAFTLDDLKDVITLSNDSAVQETIGYDPTGKDISNDNKLNETDIGEVLMETPEDTSAKFRTTTVVKGWDSTRDSVDESINNFLADRHQVAKVYVIDYYIDDLKINITVTEGLANKVEKTAIKTFMSDAKDQGAEVTYDDNTGLRADWTDFDFAYMPRDVTSTEWQDMKTDLSNAVRKKCFSMVALTQSRPNEVVDPLFSLRSTAQALDIPLTGDLKVGTTYQETNALIGSILQGSDYTAVDAEELDSQMASQSASGFNTIEDGKTTTSGLSLIVAYASWFVWIVIISITAISALLIGVMIGKHRKHKHGKKH